MVTAMLRQLFSDPEAPPFAARRPSSSSSTATTRSNSTGRGDGDRPEPVPSFDLDPSAVVEVRRVCLALVPVHGRMPCNSEIRLLHRLTALLHRPLKPSGGER